MSIEVSNDNTFIHTGTVSRVSGNTVVVSLDQNVHCESCAAKSACGVSDSRARELEVSNTASSFNLNDPVKVVIKKDLGLKAVFWAYVFPFVLLLAVLLTGSLFLEEWLAGLLALAVLAPYYFVLNRLNSFFRKKFRVSVLKLV